MGETKKDRKKKCLLSLFKRAAARTGDLYFGIDRNCCENLTLTKEILFLFASRSSFERSKL